MHLRLFVAFLLLVQAGFSSAVLGGLPEKFNNGDTTVMSKVASNYSILDTTLATGTNVREYVSDKGVVFAIVWSGPFLPELKVLLGRYFDAMRVESAREPRAGRSHISINHPEVVINAGGHMRAFEGDAWIPDELPIGFSVGDE